MKVLDDYFLPIEVVYTNYVGSYKKIGPYFESLSKHKVNKNI